METPHKPRYIVPPVVDSPLVDNPLVDTLDTPAAPRSPTRYEPSGGARKHPIIVLTGLWLVLLVLGWLSMSEIISPGADVPLPSTPIAQTQKDQSSSLGVLGAIAGSCAVLSLLLSQKIDRR